MTTPAISIITPCLNAAAFVAEMVESVRAGPGLAVEHLVIDGGSSDGTRERLARYPHLRVVEGADRGSHDAMNRGLALAGGEIIGFINTDDRYAPRLLAAVTERFAAEPALDALLGRSYLLARRGADWRVVAQHPLCRGGGLDLGDLMYGVPCVNARFFRRRILDRLGGFSLRFSFAADRHFLLRLALAGGRSAVLDRPCYFYRIHGGSRTLDPDSGNARAIGHEHIAIARILMASSAIEPAQRRALGGWLAYETLRAALRGAPAPLQPTLLAALPRGLAGKHRARAHRRRTPPVEAALAEIESW